MLRLSVDQPDPAWSAAILAKVKPELEAGKFEVVLRHRFYRRPAETGAELDAVRISAIVTGHFGDRDRRPEEVFSGPFRHRDRPFRRS